MCSSTKSVCLSRQNVVAKLIKNAHATVQMTHLNIYHSNSVAFSIMLASIKANLLAKREFNAARVSTSNHYSLAHRLMWHVCCAIEQEVARWRLAANRAHSVRRKWDMMCHYDLTPRPHTWTHNRKQFVLPSTIIIKPANSHEMCHLLIYYFTWPVL